MRQVVYFSARDFIYNLIYQFPSAVDEILEKSESVAATGMIPWALLMAPKF